MGIFDKIVLTPEQAVAAQIDNELRMTALTMKASYIRVRQLIYANSTFKDEYGAFDSDVVYAAYVANSVTGLTVDQLGQAARVIKTIINMYAPGTLVDEVPEVTITY